jgi:hypothetical protein
MRRLRPAYGTYAPRSTIFTICDGAGAFVKKAASELRSRRQVPPRLTKAPQARRQKLSRKSLGVTRFKHKIDVKRSRSRALVSALLTDRRIRQGEQEDGIMDIELFCTTCGRHFVAPAHAHENEIHDRMAGDGSWYDLGDGHTFEDMIFSTLTQRGAIRCPHCGDLVHVSEESLGQVAMAMLAGF